MIPFRAPVDSIGSLDPRTAAALVSATADIALVVDADGVIRDLTLPNGNLGPGEQDDWLGQTMASTVTVESRPKVEELLSHAAANEPARWRHVNHLTREGDLPILYSAVALGGDRGILALGRNMRPTAELQQRLVDAQHTVEREYAKLRHLETRYRLLFQMAREAVVVIDPASGTVLEANPAASEQLGIAQGHRFPAGFDAEGTEQVAQLVARVQATGGTDEVPARAADGPELDVSASLFRHEGATLMLLRAAPGAGAAPREGRSRLLEVIDGLPDAFVVTGTDGRILSANGAFLELAQLTNVEQAVGESIDRWLGRPGVDLSVLTANLREHGSVRLFSTIVRGEQGVDEEVEISAVHADGPQACFGFVVRSVGRRPASQSRVGQALPRSAEQLTELVGRVPLKDLVRETTDLIERLCIEAALDITGDNRASAAEMLGLSRQSLYVKLRRYGVIDGDPSTD